MDIPLTMDKTEAIERLGNLLNDTGGDEEVAHIAADGILTAVLRQYGLSEVADAFDKACNEVGFWYS